MTKEDPKDTKTKVAVGVIVLCRYNSKRLPGKILMKIKGREALGYIVERLSLISPPKDIVVATSVERDDDAIADFCKAHKIKCFRGSKDNVAERILECAKKYKFDYFVRICGDNIFTDYKLTDRMINIAIDGRYNLVSNLKGRTFPSGISVEVLKTEFFEDIIADFKTADDREHVTSYLYEHEPKIGSHYYVYNDICPQAKEVKLSLDDANDLNFITEIVKRMDRPHTEYLLNDIYELSKKVSQGLI